MKITRENLKNIVREAMIEENEYQEFFKKALEKTGKSIPQMSDEEKKAFFNKIEATWKGKGEKNERFGRGVEGPTFGSANEEDLDEEAVVVSKRTPEGNIVSKLKEELESVNEANTIGKMAKKYKNKDKFISAFFAHMKKNYGDSFKDFEKDKGYRDNIGKIWDDEHGVKESINEGSDWILLSSIGKLIDSWNGTLMDKNDPMFGEEVPFEHKKNWAYMYKRASSKDKKVMDGIAKKLRAESVTEASMDWEKNFKWANDKELKVISKFIFMNDRGIDGVIKMSKHKPSAFKRTIQKMAKKGLHEAKGNPKFKKGDRVKVTGTQYKGKSGLIMSNDMQNGQHIVQIDDKMKGIRPSDLKKESTNEEFKSKDSTFEKVYGMFDKRDYFNAKGLAKVQIGNFERALQKNDNGAQQILDKFNGDMDKAKEYIIQVITDRKKEEAFNQYKAFKAAVDSIQKGNPIHGAVDLVKSRIHNNSQKYTMALYSAFRNQKFNKWKDIHADIDSLIGESVNEAKTYTPKQVKQALEKMVKQLKAKWKQKGGYENFGQRELDKFKKTFGYSPYGSSDEREISDLIDSFEDWAMDYSG